jgi:predicted SAM-dependent methyltransferase
MEISTSARPEWSWEHPPTTRAHFNKLELVPITPAFTRQQLRDLGLSGLQFAEWKSQYRACLNTDIVGIQCSESVTERGKIYLVDGESYFVELDAREPLPFEDDSVDWVCAEHFIEHLSLAEAIRWLTEVRRLLVPGGLVRLTTPDLRKYVESYLSEDGGFFAEHRRGFFERGARPIMPDRRAFMMNLVFYYWGHRWVYDFDELRFALTQAGFSPDLVRRWSFRKGARPDIAELDRLHRRHETMYVEASL